MTKGSRKKGKIIKNEKQKKNFIMMFKIEFVIAIVIYKEKEDTK